MVGYDCRICQECFEGEEDLKRHWYEFHECALCAMVFPGRDELKRHRKEYHNR